MTLGQKFRSTDGRPSGFDYLRIFLALSVVCWHSVVITYGYQFQGEVWLDPKYRLAAAGILPAFFALSGFLVAGSLERSRTLASFLYLRIIRIFPALVVEIMLSALLLGPLMTKFSPAQYFHDPVFYHYFFNCIGDIHYKLPGLFLANPATGLVNGQLWTVPFELECYIFLAVLAVLGITRAPKFFLLVVAALILFGIFDYVRGQDRSAESLHGHQLILCFLIGVALYNFREFVPYSRGLALAAFAASMLAFWIPGGGLLAPLPVSYLTIFLGLTNPRKAALLETGDYSYGIFLYGFPIQQAVVATGLVPLNGWITLLVAVPFVAFVAFCSWHLCEKHVLKLKKYRSNIDRNMNFTAPGKVSDFALGAIKAVRRFAT